MLKNDFIAISILVFLFLLKGVVFLITTPILQGPDEQIHYGTIQHWSEPKEKTWATKKGESTDIKDTETLNLSEEVKMTAKLTQFDEVKWQKDNTQDLSPLRVSQNEDTLLHNTWKRYIDTEPNSASGALSWYYFFGAKIESILSPTSILTRFFALRTFSVLIGSLVVVLAYLIMRELSFSRFQSFLFAALILFQPMTSFIASIVNIDIALIFSFTLFTYAAIRTLKDDARYSSLLLLLVSAIIGFLAKGPGIVLFGLFIPIAGYFFFQRYPKNRTWLLSLGIAGIIIAGIGTAFLFPKYVTSLINLGQASVFSSPVVSLSKYADKALSVGDFRNTAESYWGYFGWLDTKVAKGWYQFFWALDMLAAAGILFLFLSKKVPDYLPKKRYLVLCIGMILALQVAIHFYDWRVFDSSGKILIGSPGRYFLPNIVPHFILLISGIGFLVKDRHWFNFFLKAFTLLMIIYSAYVFLDVLVPRYYL